MFLDKMSLGRGHVFLPVHQHISNGASFVWEERESGEKWDGMVFSCGFTSYVYLGFGESSLESTHLFFFFFFFLVLGNMHTNNFPNILRLVDKT